MLYPHAVNLEDDKIFWLASSGPWLKEELSPGYSAKGKQWEHIFSCWEPRDFDVHGFPRSIWNFEAKNCFAWFLNHMTRKDAW